MKEHAFATNTVSYTIITLQHDEYLNDCLQLEHSVQAFRVLTKLLHSKDPEIVKLHIKKK
jgi:hypothetical protein